MKLTEALEGYDIYAEGELAPGTIADYKNTFRKFLAVVGGDIEVEDIKKFHVQKFLNQAAQTVSDKTRSNYHIGLSALWTWMLEEEIVEKHIVRLVKRPKPEKREIVEFTEKEVKLLLASLERSKAYVTHGGTVTSHGLQNRLRNRMIILVLLTTGCRASELCGIKLKDVDLPNRRIKVMGKGSKERFLPISDDTTRKAIWTYLQKRANKEDEDPLVVSSTGLHLTRDGLRQLLDRIGKRAEVKNVHPHRFRHTFAIEYLRNGGDVYTLQMILGHSDLTMCRRYLNIATGDVQRVHRHASPVANWNL